MILYLEAAAWSIRAAMFTFWLAGALIGQLIDTPQTTGLVHGFIPRYLLFVFTGIILNLIMSGLPELKSHQKPKNLVFFGKFNVTVFQTIIFLLQGSKVRSVIRNITTLEKPKNIYISASGDNLYIEDSGIETQEESFTSFIILVTSFAILLIAPGLMLGIMRLIQLLFLTVHIPAEMAGPILKYFTLIFLTCFLFPYAATQRSYLDSSVRVFSKYMFDAYGYPVYTSPLIGFIRPYNHFVGLADPRNRIFVNYEYVKETYLLNYIIAHEAAHLKNKVLKVKKFILVPIIFPLIIFFLYSAHSYFLYVDLTNLAITFQRAAIVAFILVIFFWLKLFYKEENDADKFAVRFIGIDAVKIALHELAYRHRRSYPAFKRKNIFEKRLERIEKCRS